MNRDILWVCQFDLLNAKCMKVRRGTPENISVAYFSAGCTKKVSFLSKMVYKKTKLLNIKLG